MKRALPLLLVLAALAAPAAASAHAILVRTIPANGAVLAHAPGLVRVEFDDTVRVGSGIAAVANATRLSVLAGKASARGHVLAIPLRANLARGDYSVRWSIVSDDGHREQGVLAFAVGAGTRAPHAVLTAGAGLGWSDVVFRTLFYLGVLGAGGAAGFALLAYAALGAGLRRPLSQLLFAALLLAFIGGSGIVHAAPSGTRYALVLKAGLTLAVLGGAAAALAPLYPSLLLLAGACALALLAAPTLSGHALDHNQPRWVSVPADLVHSAAAALWLGGLVSLLYLLSRTPAGESERARVTRRFSAAALASVVALAASGLLRALTELRSVSQIWSTSYGQALIVKSALFVPLVGLGWLNRALLLESFARLRRSVRAEVAVLVMLVVVVSVLTQLRPGKAAPSAAKASPVAAAQPVLPPRDAVVDARELGSIAVAVARTPLTTTVTLVRTDGTGSSGRDVRIDGRRASACGSGCYRARGDMGPVAVAIGGKTLRFDVPARAPDGTRLLSQVTRAYGSLRTAVFDESLRSSPSTREVTRFELVAPDRLAYRIRGGPQAVVIGPRRWDRDSPSSRWVESQQTRLEVMQPYWRNPTNVRLVASGTLTFLDRAIPAWFRVTLDPHRRLPRRVRMAAAAHFMVDRYAGYDVPVELSPPSR